MKVAVVFDTPNPGWEDEDFKKEVEAQIPEEEYEVGEALIENGHEVLLVGVYDDLHHMVVRLREFVPDLVFNCAETFLGNDDLDYVFPALLEAEGYRYTGASPLPMLLTRDKALSKEVLAQHGVRVPDFVTYRPGEEVLDAPPIEFPLIVKPARQDSSEGIAATSVVRDLEALAGRVEFIHGRFGQAAIAEQFLEGRELYVGILGNEDDLEILPHTELVFDKELNKPEERIATKYAKWNLAYRERRKIKSQFARPLSKVAKERLDETARISFRALHLRDYARLDVRLAPDDEVWVMEANCNPYISFGHEMANAAEKYGMDYYEFVERLVRVALARYEPRPAKASGQ
ncbi:MAG: hypothetical protein ACE5JR_09245 [Gemmatimonadota bacterium]